jgi:hypothetical protein
LGGYTGLDPPVKTTKENLTYKSRVEPKDKYGRPPTETGRGMDETSL